MADQPNSLFTPQQIQEDANNRVARTGNQSVGAFSLVIILQWYVAAHAKSVIGVVPSEVWNAVQTLLTIGAAWYSNRKRVANLTADPAVVAQPVQPVQPAAEAPPATA